jgi:hypothetical protein
VNIGHVGCHRGQSHLGRFERIDHIGEIEQQR